MRATNTFKALSDEQWKAIRAVRDDWPNSVDWDDVRLKIDEAGRYFSESRADRLRFGPPVKIRDTLRRLLLQIARLQQTLRSLPPNFVGRAPDPYLDTLVQQLNRWLESYEYLSGPAFRGRKFIYRDSLYACLLYVWIGTIGAEPSFSRTLDNTPYGPIIDFFTLSLKAILGKAPGPSRVAKIIERRRWLARNTSPFPYQADD